MSEHNRQSADYLINDTIVLDNANRNQANVPFTAWEFDHTQVDNPMTVHVIERSGRNRVRILVLPQSEYQHYTNGEQVWTAAESEETDRTTVTASLDPHSDEPFAHDGGYVLVLEEVKTSSDAKTKVSVKLS